jgi:hypothetical protein
MNRTAHPGEPSHHSTFRCRRRSPHDPILARHTRRTVELAASTPGPVLTQTEKTGGHTSGQLRVSEWMLCAGKRPPPSQVAPQMGDLPQMKAMPKSSSSSPELGAGARSRPAAPAPVPRLDGRAFAARRARPPFVCAREAHGPRVGADTMEICRMLRRDWCEDQPRHLDARAISHATSHCGLAGFGPIPATDARPTTRELAHPQQLS